MRMIYVVFIDSTLRKLKQILIKPCDTKYPLSIYTIIPIIILYTRTCDRLMLYLWREEFKSTFLKKKSIKK